MEFKGIKLNIKRFSVSSPTVFGDTGTSNNGNTKIAIGMDVWTSGTTIYVKPYLYSSAAAWAQHGAKRTITIGSYYQEAPANSIWPNDTSNFKNSGRSDVYTKYVDYPWIDSTYEFSSSQVGTNIYVECSFTGNTTTSYAPKKGVTLKASTYITTVATKYVYYNQGNASSNTNLPATQSALQGNSLTLATNRMTRNSANTTTNTIKFYVEDVVRGTKYCYINTSYSANGWATSKDGAFAYTNGQSVTMGSDNLTLYPYFTPSNTQIPLTLPSLNELQVTIPNKALDGWYTQGYTNKVGDAGDSVYLTSQPLYAKLINVSNVKYNPNNTGFTTTNVYLSTNGGNFNLITADKIKKL